MSNATAGRTAMKPIGPTLKGSVDLEPGTFYEATSQLALDSVSIRGNGSTIFAKHGMVARPGSSISLDSLTVHAQESHFCLTLQSGHADVRNCRFFGAKSYLVDVNGPVRAVIEGCVLRNSAGHGIRFRGAAVGLFSCCEIADYKDYGIQIEGTPAISPTVTVQHCYVGVPRSSVGGARQPIVAVNPSRARNIYNLNILYNVFEGSGNYFHKTEFGNGTGDQISLRDCENFRVIGNTSARGGENGLTLSHGCRAGEIAGNLFTLNDGHGCQVSSADSEGCSLIHVHDNLMLDNGLRKRPGRPDSLASLYIHRGHDITTDRNRLIGDSCKYGVNFSESFGISLGNDSMQSDRRDFTPYYPPRNLT